MLLKARRLWLDVSRHRNRKACILKLCGREVALPEDEAELGEGTLRVARLKVQVLAPGGRNAELLDQRLVLPA